MKHKHFNSEKGANAIQFLDVLVGLATEYHMEDTHQLVLKALNNRIDVFVDRSGCIFLFVGIELDRMPVRPHVSKIIREKIGTKGRSRLPVF
jgi:hypothetical protein